MTFKKSIALLLSGSMLAAAALTGCGSDNTASAVSNTAGKDLLDQIQARGSITVAMEGTWAPWTYHDENDELVHLYVHYTFPSIYMLTYHALPA